MKNLRGILGLISLAMVMAMGAHARIKLVALPERGDTVIRLDNPHATLIEEERVLTLQQGLNNVDFSWNGVHIQPDSIRLTVLDHPEEVTLLNVSYPPNEASLVWEIAAANAGEERVRISYLLSFIDRLVTYKGVADKEETSVDLRSFLILRNFSGEDFDDAHILLDYGSAFEQGVRHEETKQLLFLKAGSIPMTKVWTFDARSLPWDPEKVNGNVGIPVSYRMANTEAGKLGAYALHGGKMRVFQQDGAGGTIFLGEDTTELVPVGEDLEIYIGDSRDIVVTQRKMHSRRINIRRNDANRIVLYDLEERITAEIENFKDKPATLTMIQQIQGEWDMQRCSAEYELEDFQTLKFEIDLEPKGKTTLTMDYIRRHLR